MAREMIVYSYPVVFERRNGEFGSGVITLPLRRGERRKRFRIKLFKKTKIVYGRDVVAILHP